MDLKGTAPAPMVWKWAGTPNIPQLSSVRPQHPLTEQYPPVRWAERIHFHHVLTGLGDLWLYRGVSCPWNLGPGCCAQWLQASLDGDPCWAQVQPLDSWHFLEGKVQWNDQHDYKGGPQRQVLLVHRSSTKTPGLMVDISTVEGAKPNQLTTGGNHM
jgi:hypothetical protein